MGKFSPSRTNVPSQAVAGQWAANVGGTFGTFGASDTTPSVTTGNLFKTHASEQTLAKLDDGSAGQIVTIISTHDVTFAYNSSGTGAFKCGSANIVTASGDVTQWVYDGTNWYLLGFMDVDQDLTWEDD